MMMVASNIRIPSELRTSPPRMVRLRGGRGARVFGVRIFMLPHLLIGLAAAVILIGEPIWLFATPAILGKVTSMQTSAGRRGMQHEVHYTYLWNGRTVTDQSRVSTAAYQQLQREKTIPLHAIDIGGHRFSEVDVSAGQYAASRWFLWIWAFLWDGMMLLVLRQPRVARRLVSEGAAVTGKIVDKSTYRGKSARYTLRYEYAPPTGGTMGALTRNMTVTRGDFESVAVGQEITVLYDPNRPSNATIYEYGDYMAG